MTTCGAAGISVVICSCCGSTDFCQKDILWPALIEEWGLSKSEVDYINRQQGLICKGCNANLRSVALAQAIMDTYGYKGLFSQFVRSWRFRRLRMLEINEAGTLTPYCSKMPGHCLAKFPEIDMMDLSFSDCSFDMVIHSDTLEHVPEPLVGLQECCRVLRKGGFCFFTVPIIVNRLTRSRAAMSPSYHGTKSNLQDDFRVHTEYGADAWTDVLRSGFRECRIHTIEFPSAQTLIGVK